MSASLKSTPSLRDEILAYSRQVRWNLITCGVQCCPHCETENEDSARFSRHGTRSRRIRVIIGSYVQTVDADVPRWRCSGCRRTFTEYPPFLIRQKQYSVPQMARRALAYITTASVSYRRAACNSGQPLFHQRDAKDQENKECPPIMAHTSVFHWVTTLGTHTLDSSGASRESRPIAPWKYTTPARKATLVACRENCQSRSG